MGRTTRVQSLNDEPDCCGKVQATIVGGLERLFFKYGSFVASHPIPVIIISLVFGGLCGLPMFLGFEEERDGLELWVPKDSNFYSNSKWLSANFPSGFRFNAIILAVSLLVTTVLVL